MTNILAAENIPETARIELAQQGLTIINRADVSQAQLAEIDIMFGWNKVIGPQILAIPNHRLKWIQTATSGIDYLPLQTLIDQNILVTNARGMHAVPIAQTVMSYLLYFTRGIYQSLNAQRQRVWDHHPIGQSTMTLEGRTILIFGTGQIGEKVAQYAQTMGLKAIGVNRNGEPINHFEQIVTTETVDQVLEQADFIVNGMPLTSETTDYFNADFFAKVAAGTYFFNVGRGKSVNEAALMAALNAGQLAGAAIDVAQNEPLVADSPLWSTPNLVITPHISGYIPDLHERVYTVFARNLPTFLADGHLTYNTVSLTEGY